MFSNKEYILTIYNEGSFSKAANKLYISQPSLSASVKRIEEKVSVPLFDRSTTPISLTEAGQEYVKYALEIKEREQDFERYISDYTKILTGTVRIGGSSLFSSYMLPKMISRFNKEYANVNFEIQEDNTKNLMNKLVLGELDLIIDNAKIDSSSINATIYTTEMLLLAVPKEFEVNKKLIDYRMTSDDVKKGMQYSENYNVDLTHFSNYPFILLNPDNDTGKRANILFKKYGINPEVIFTLDQQVTAHNISCTGMGISFVSDTLIEHIESDTPLFYYRLTDDEVFRKIYFYKKNNHYLSQACQKFIDANTKSQPYG